MILAPSLSLIPLFSVTVPLSLPAKSIKDNLPTKLSVSVFETLLVQLICNVKTAWDLDEV